MNDVWIIYITSQNPNWISLEFQNNVIPSPRLYHTSIVYNKGKASRMIIIFDGRDSNLNSLNDLWGLR